MQAVDDVDFGERLVGALPQLVPRLLERHRVRAVVAGLQPRERAEEAARDADVGRFETDVEVVVGPRAVPLLALAVREPAERQQCPDSRTACTPSSNVEAHAGLRAWRRCRARPCGGETRAHGDYGDALILTRGPTGCADRRARPRARAATGRARARRRSPAASGCGRAASRAGGRRRSCDRSPSARDRCASTCRRATPSARGTA